MSAGCKLDAPLEQSLQKNTAKSFQPTAASNYQTFFMVKTLFLVNTRL